MTTTAKIRLDKSKPFSECHGERTPDDPHYHVHYWQGGPVGKAIVLLPFNSQGELVPDDGKTEPYMGGNVDGKPVQHYPLYNQAMRDLVERKLKRLNAAKNEGPADEDAPAVLDGEQLSSADPADDVDFGAWLRGEARYQPTLLRAAAKQRFGKAYREIGPMVFDLVFDEKIVPEDQVCAELAKHLKVAA